MQREDNRESVERSRRHWMIAAARAHDSEVVRALLEHHVNLANFHDDDGQTPLLAAIDGNTHPSEHSDGEFSQFETVKVLCEYGALTNLRNFTTGVTPLCLATLLNLPRVICHLIRHKADVNLAMISTHPTFGRWTPLMFAVHTGESELCMSYIDMGADGTARTGALSRTSTEAAMATEIPQDIEDFTALELACMEYSADLVNSTKMIEHMLKKCCRTCGKTSVNMMRNAYLEGRHTPRTREPFAPLQKLKRCRGCSTRYCSRECQVADWCPRHRNECQ